MRVTKRDMALGISLIAVSLFFTVGLLEAMFRLWPNLLPVRVQSRIEVASNRLAVSHPYIGHLHAPKATGVIFSKDFKAVHHTDSYGFRNPVPWPDQADIVAVGDSLTFGYGVKDDQAWPAIVNRALPGSDVINLGLIGAGPQQYLRVFETFGSKLRPRLLLVGFFARNDFWDANLFERWLNSGAAPNYLVWRDYGRPGGLDRENDLSWEAEFIVKRSYLYNLLREVRDAVRNRFQTQITTLRLSDGNRLDLDIGDFENKVSGALPDSREFRLVVKTLQDLHSIAERDGTNVLVVLQPSKEEVYLPLLGEPSPDLQGPLRTALEEGGIPYLDLLPGFRRRAAKGEALFFQSDGHPNGRGYALIADLVLSHLKNKAEKYDLPQIMQTSSPQE
jgi:hypothetical protein